MSEKFYSTAAIAFNEAAKGVSMEDCIAGYKEDSLRRQREWSMETTPEYRAEKELERSLPYILEAYSFYEAIKKWKKQETYKVDPWGYDQTNYENFTVIGEYRGSLVCADFNCKVWTVRKNKYKAGYTNLDGVRSTQWEPAYTDKQISDQREYNNWHGH
jgi:hypothetical protein